jgi:hypothetical protein
MNQTIEWSSPPTMRVFVGDDAFHLCGNVCCPHGFLAFVGVKATLLRRRGIRFRRIFTGNRART